MPKLESVLFDLDGTLLDSVHDITQGINLMLADDGRPVLSIKDIKPMLGYGAMELCRRVLLKTGGVMADDLFPYVQKFIMHYRSIIPDPNQVFSGAREVLETLQTQGIKLGVCTNKADSATHEILKALDLSRYFDFIAGGDTFEVHKPNPRHVTGVLEKLCVRAQGSVFVGDGPADATAAKGAGVSCVIITHGYSEDLTDLGDALINNFDELIPTIKKMGLEFC